MREEKHRTAISRIYDRAPLRLVIRRSLTPIRVRYKACNAKCIVDLFSACTSTIPNSRRCWSPGDSPADSYCASECFPDVSCVCLCPCLLARFHVSPLDGSEQYELDRLRVTREIVLSEVAQDL